MCIGRNGIEELFYQLTYTLELENVIPPRYHFIKVFNGRFKVFQGF